MRVSVVELDIKLNDVQANLSVAEKIVAEYSSKSDLMVFPEMFTTGFCMNHDDTLLPSGDVLEWFRRVAAKNGTAIAGSVAVMDNGLAYNRMYFVLPSGKAYMYDKRHLFTYSGEDKHFNKGEKRVVAEYNGVRFMLQVCYDLRFPVYSRNLNDYDVLLYVASWPEQRIFAWDSLLPARAIENQACLIGVNRIGTDSQCNYNGHSQILDHKGISIVSNLEVSQYGANILTATLDIEKMRKFRERMPVWKDADEFVIK